MNNKTILIKMLRKHSTNFIESQERGIAVDDLDVDSFIDEVDEIFKEKYENNNKSLNDYSIDEIIEKYLDLDDLYIALKEHHFEEN